MHYLGKHFRSFDQYVQWMYCCEDYNSRVKLLKSVQYLAIKKVMDNVIRKPSRDKLRLHIGTAMKKLQPVVFSRTLLDKYVGEYDFVGRIYDENCIPVVLKLEREPDVKIEVEEVKVKVEEVEEVKVEDVKAENFVEDCRSEIQDLVFGLRVVHEYAGEAADVVVNTVNLSHVDGAVYVPIVSNEKKEDIDKLVNTLKLLRGKSVIIIVDESNELLIRSALNL